MGTYINTIFEDDEMVRCSDGTRMRGDRRMWHECSMWTKTKRIVAALLSGPILLTILLLLWSFRFYVQLLLYAGGSKWKWKWKF